MGLNTGPSLHDDLLAEQFKHHKRAESLESPANARPPIENVVFEGGGAKGIVYCGAIQAIEAHESGAKNTIKRVCGSSAGSMVAMLWSLGYTSDEIKKVITEDLDFTDIQDQRCEWDPKVTGPKGIPIGISTIINLFKHKGAFKGEKLHDVMASLIRNKLNEKINAYIELKYADMFKQEREFCQQNGFDAKTTEDRLRRLREDKAEQLKDELEIHNLGEATFGQIKQLNEKFSEFPGMKGLDLYVTGTRLTDGSLQVFSHESDPNMPVVLATQISGCFPGGFEPIYYRGHYYADGGIADNAPMKVFDNEAYLSHGRNQAGVNPCTLGFLVDSREEINRRWGVGAKEDKPKLSLKSYVGQIMGAYHSRLEELKRLHDQNIIQIWDTEIETMELDLSEEQKANAIDEGARTTNAYLNQYMGDDVVYQAKTYSDMYENYYQMSQIQLQDGFRQLGHDLIELTAMIDVIEATNFAEHIEHIEKSIETFEQTEGHAAIVAEQRELYERYIALNNDLMLVDNNLKLLNKQHEQLAQQKKRLANEWANFVAKSVLDLESQPLSQRKESLEQATRELDEAIAVIEAKQLEEQAKKERLYSMAEDLESQKHPEVFDWIAELEGLLNIEESDLLDRLKEYEQIYHEHMDALVDVMQVRGLAVTDPRVEAPDEDLVEEEPDGPDVPVASAEAPQSDVDLGGFEFAQHLNQLADRLITGNWGDFIPFESRQDRAHNQHLEKDDSGNTIGHHLTGYHIRHIKETPSDIEVTSHYESRTKAPAVEAFILSPEDATLVNPNKPIKELFMVFKDPIQEPGKHKQYGKMRKTHANRERNFEQVKESYLKQLRWALRHVAQSDLQPKDAKIHLTISGQGMGAMDAQLMLKALMEELNDPSQKALYPLNKIELSITDAPKVSKQAAKSFAKAVREVNTKDPDLELVCYQNQRLETPHHFVPECYLGRRSLMADVESQDMQVSVEARSKTKGTLKSRWTTADHSFQQYQQTINKPHRFYSSVWYREYAACKQQARNFSHWLVKKLPKKILGFGLMPVKISSKLIGPYAQFGKLSGRMLSQGVDKFRRRKQKPPIRHWQQAIESTLASSMTSSDEPGYSLQQRVQQATAKTDREARLQQASRPPIENLVFGGGGVNNIAMVGALKSLESHGQLDSVKRLAGSSYGGLLATLLAVGYSPQELEDLCLDKLDFQQLLDPSSPVDIALFKYKGHKIGPFSIISLFQNKALYRGEALQNLMAGLIAYKIEDKLKEAALSRFTREQISRLGQGYHEDGSMHYNEIVDKLLANEVQKLMAEFGINDLQNITMNQLQQLNEAFPELGFKEIYLTGTKLSTSEMKEFSYRTEPDMPILKAVSIAMAVPFAMPPVEHAGETYVSGDTSDVYPMSIFDNPEFLSHGLNDANANPCTLGFMVDKKENILARWGITSEQKRHIRLDKYAEKIIQGMINRTEELEKYDINTIQIENIRGTNEQFHASNQVKQQLIAEGERAVDEYLSLYWSEDADYAAQKSFKNFMHKYYGMTELQLIEIHKQEVAPLISELRDLRNELESQITIAADQEFNSDEIPLLTNALALKENLHKCVKAQQKTGQQLEQLSQKLDRLEQAKATLCEPYTDLNYDKWPPDVLERLQGFEQSIWDTKKEISEMTLNNELAKADLQQAQAQYESALTDTISDSRVDAYHAYQEQQNLLALKATIEQRLEQLEFEEGFIFKALKTHNSNYTHQFAAGRLPKLDDFRESERQSSMTHLRDHERQSKRAEKIPDNEAPEDAAKKPARLNPSSRRN